MFSVSFPKYISTKVAMTEKGMLTAITIVVLISLKNTIAGQNGKGCT